MTKTLQRCCICYVHKKQAEFNRGYLSCKRCLRGRRKYAAGYREKNREKCREYARRYYHTHKAICRTRARLNKYNLTDDDYSALKMIQNGLCAICMEKHPLHIDHCHHTGVVRGLLCKKCNFGLGYFNDAPKNLLAAIKYLEKSQEVL